MSFPHNPKEDSQDWEEISSYSFSKKVVMSGSLWRANLRATREETQTFSAQGQGGKDMITKQLVTVLLRRREPAASYLFNLFDVWIIVFLIALVRPHSFLGFIKSDNLEHKIGPFHDLENTGLLA